MIRSSHPSVSGADHMAMMTARQLSVCAEIQVTLALSSSMYPQFHACTEHGVEHLFIPTDVRQAKLIIESRDFDAMHLFDFVDANYLWLANDWLNSGKPLYVTPASDMRLWENDELGLNLCRNAQMVFAWTEHERRSLLETSGIPPEKVTVLKYAVTQEEQSAVDFRQAFSIPQSAKLVLFLGRKLTFKGYELILESMSAIWSEFPHAWFVFIGPRTETSVQAFSSYGHNERMLEMDMVDEQIKRAALQACDLLCLPSKVDVFPIVFLEAWSFAKPVVTSRFPGSNEAVRHGIDGLVTDPDAPSVTEAIRSLLSDSAYAVRLGANGLERVQREHTWDAMIATLLDVYSKHRDEVKLR